MYRSLSMRPFSAYSWDLRLISAMSSSIFAFASLFIASSASDEDFRCEE